MVMFPRSWLFVFIIILLVSTEVSPWRRRRRRRAPPPPPVNCQASAWGAWTECSEDCSIGSRTRRRDIDIPPAFGGSSCPTTTDTDDCGQINGGCEDKCLTGGQCACISRQGYEADGKSCVDKNECADGSAVCVNANCRNTDGSYVCDCYPGYDTSSNPRQCDPKQCSPLTAPQCPADAYSDSFGSTCKPVTISCPNGREFLDSCTLNCLEHYKLAVIPRAESGQKFAQNYTTVDFITPSDKTDCKVDQDSGAVNWDWNPVSSPYYCRRSNDPPLRVTLSRTTINEKTAFLTTVGTFTAVDFQNDLISYNILNPEGNFYFLIQGNSLLIKNRLVWQPNDNNTFSVVVKASDNGSPMMYLDTSFSITVLNVNDAPYNLELSRNEVYENVPPGFIVGNLTANDDDIGVQKTSNFSWKLISSDDGFFSLRGNQIVVAKALDHESKNIHRIEVQCTDYGSPRMSSQVASMFIVVRDTNDSPKYINLTNNRVAENSLPGTVVGDFIAMDDDNDTLLFNLNATDGEDLEKFSLKGAPKCELRRQDGKSFQTCSLPLIVNESLDYEDKNEYMIWLAVTDPGGVTRKRFIIEVTNENEKPTDILITEHKVPENSPGGTVVGEFLVKDPDNKNGLTQTHHCSLVNSLNGDEDAFYISQQDQRNLLRVKANRILDFESKRSYNVTVNCKDTTLGISRSFFIEVTDVNEPPTSLRLSNTSVDENRSNIIIGTLTAEDPEGTNQTFFFTVQNSKLFAVRNSNQLFLLEPLDFEHTPSISVHLRVTDVEGLYLERVFTITVKDVNDPPSDIKIRDDSMLAENSVQDIFISSVEMLDEDSDTRAVCQLLNTSNDRVRLNGLSLLAGPTVTDYEALGSPKSLQILISCSDEHGATVEKWISLPVQDVNEAPTNLTLSKLEIRENKNNSLVATLEITDPDVGQKHNCTMLDLHTAFFIDSSVNPPLLRTQQPLDFESSTEHYVNIRCEDIVPDHKQAQHAVTKQFKISVLDVNEPPQILCDVPFHVSTSFSRGSIIGEIQSYDPDNEHYHRSKIQNPKGPFEIRKQLLNYRLEPENNSWPFDVTRAGILYLEKQLSVEGYNGSIIFGIRVDDDGIVLKMKSGSSEFEVNKDETMFSVRKCSITITTNETDLNLSSNTIYENATFGTVIGQLSRTPLQNNETVTFHIIDEENSTNPFEIDGDVLKLKLDNTLDYELLREEKTLPITISSVASQSGVFTKRFLIEILDVNEIPTEICLTSPLPLDDCSVVGYILIEDLDYPDVQCGSAVSADLTKISSKLSQYTCHIQEGTDTLGNTIIVDQHFYIEGSTPTLYAEKRIFTQGERSYDVPIVCRSTQHALHILSQTLKVNIKIPDDASCRLPDLCSACPEPTFCLSHVQARAKCVDEEYRINSTVAIPVSIFETPGFIAKFENYVKSLIEGTSGGKTLIELVQDFDNENQVSQRKRRNAPYTNVYVEQFVYLGEGTSTQVVFAVAEKPSYNLIPASEVCKLLADSEVKCSSDGINTLPRGDGQGTSGFPIWIIFVIVGVIVLASIVVLVVVRWRRQNKSYNSAAVHFVRDANRATIDSTYEIPVDSRGQSSLSRSGTSNPVLVETRRDIKVYHNPTYRSRATSKGSDSESEDIRQRSMNHYEQTDPVPIYETIDDDLYERVHDEKLQHDVESTLKPAASTFNGAESTRSGTENTKKKVKKSRSNPVYDVGEDDDSLNPVVNFSVTSPSRKAKKKGQEFFGSLEEENHDSDYDSLTAQIMSTFQAQHSYENVGTVNPVHAEEGKGEHLPKTEVVETLPTGDMTAVNPLYSDAEVKVYPTPNEEGKPGDSNLPTQVTGEMSFLENPKSFKTNSAEATHSSEC